jgi:RNA polymerase-interacting CarD/CdnL/TRCF family regulator
MSKDGFKKSKNPNEILKPTAELLTEVVNNEKPMQSQTLKSKQKITSSSKIFEQHTNIEEISIKMNQLKIRHQKDKKIVDNIRDFLKTELAAVEIDED